MRYLPHTSAEIERMLETIGASSIDALFESIPDDARFKGELRLPPSLSEAELMRRLAELGAENRPAGPDHLVFVGAGLHRHHIPSAVDALSLRGEFATAYTPYQPELSQGTLMAIFEFQTMVCELFGTDHANASMYDGASAAAEAMLMARRLTKRDASLLCDGVHPEYVGTCRTYSAGLGDPQQAVRGVPVDASGATDLEQLRGQLDESIACVIVQSPNFYGIVEDLAPVCEVAHEVGALVVAACAEPVALALAQAPGKLGADIVIGEGGGLAGPPMLGGPGVGLFGANGKKALRAMPGRLVGETADGAGNPGYVLTLATREQHIRRERATSNICTNHGLYALRFAIHLALLGQRGLRELAELNLAKTYYARELVAGLDGYELAFSGPTFNELTLRVSSGDASQVVERAASEGIVAGVPLGRFDGDKRDLLLVGFDESHRRHDIDRWAAALAAAS